MAGALALAIVVWWAWPRQEGAAVGGDASPAGEVSRVGGDAAAPDETSTPLPESSGTLTFRTVLLPHSGSAADPASVRIGIGRVSVDQASAHTRWVLSDQSGAGPAHYSDLAEIERWISAPARRMEDGRVEVGPVQLPADADRFDLKGGSEHPLAFYLASFTPASLPGQIAPSLVSGLRVRRAEMEDEVSVRLLLRRVEGAADEGKWRPLIAERAPELLEAYDDAGLPVDAYAGLSPLPPGAVDVVLDVDGVEAERRRVTLVAGEWSDLQFSDEALEAAAAMAATVELEFVVKGTSDPIEGVEATWYSPRGDLVRLSGADGVASFRGVDRLQAHRFSLRMPGAENGLPRWPESEPLELSFDEPATDGSSAKVVRWKVELAPLLWLTVDPGPLSVTAFRQRGNPYPIFVLERDIGGMWQDVASDYFLPVPEGLAVSIKEEGRYRIMALASPWTVYRSASARVAADDSPIPHVGLMILPGHTTRALVTLEGQPIRNMPVTILGPARGLPPLNLTTDGDGYLELHRVTVDAVRVEVPGYLQTTIDVTPTLAEADLVPDEEDAGSE